MNDAPDWAVKSASEARDEQRSHPRWYPSTERERLELEYSEERYYEKKYEEPEDE